MNFQLFVDFGALADSFLQLPRPLLYVNKSIAIKKLSLAEVTRQN